MSAENAWDVAKAAIIASPEVFLETAAAIASLPMPPAFRAEVEAEELRDALVQIAALVPAHIAGEIARKALSRLEAKGESHE